MSETGEGLGRVKLLHALESFERAKAGGARLWYAEHVRWSRSNGLPAEVTLEDLERIEAEVTQ